MEDNRPSRILSLVMRLAGMPVLSFVIASLSLLASMSQAYISRKNIETVQTNVLRTESLRTCREIIEVFFAFRLRAEESNAMAATHSPEAKASARREMKAMVYRFGAIGTHLGNFAPDSARERYAKLSWQLNDLAENANTLAPPEFEKRFGEADKAFAMMNDDCVKATRFN